ncbi:unnamed protein product [Phytomonas sp. EM1]|nr:unnamed protein product [Phytomonas sp. EM1]|eukprot:CCW63101.1 unnamed protein product [Phytomonas sp. isolate EM1]
MQPQAPPMTSFEENITRAYQFLTEARLQSALMFNSTNFCMERCLDTEELYTLRRTTQAPIRYRLQKDLEEKQCVQNCSAKWDVILRTVIMEANEREVREVQADAMARMLRAMQNQQQ